MKSDLLRLAVLCFCWNPRPVNTNLGDYPCFSHSQCRGTLPMILPTWIAGNMGWAVLDTFGLPLVTGLVGGQSIFPITAPAFTF
jgi:hypothetical protein